MSFREDLDARRRTANAAFHRFRTMPKAPENVYLFLEGYDDCSYYRAAANGISALKLRSLKDIICFGKKNMDRVIQMYYASPFTSLRVVFIRDSDFDLFLGAAPVGEHVLMTDGYSVENYLCTPAIVERLIIDKLAIDPLEVNVNLLVREHFDVMAKLFTHLAPFVGAALHAIREGRQLHLDALDVRALYKALREGRSPVIDETLGCGLVEKDFNEESVKVGLAFVEQDHMRWLRGKYALGCLALFVEESFSNFSQMLKNGDISRFNRHLSADFSSSAVFERLVSVADIPPTITAAFERLAA